MARLIIQADQDVPMDKALELVSQLGQEGRDLVIDTGISYWTDGHAVSAYKDGQIDVLLVCAGIPLKGDV